MKIEVTPEIREALEKQGIFIEKEINPKFKARDYIVSNDGNEVLFISNVSKKGKCYELYSPNHDIKTFSPIEAIDTNYRKWKITDAKEGDAITIVDSVDDTWILVFAGIEDDKIYNYFCICKNVVASSRICVKRWSYCDGVKHARPANSGEIELISNKIKESFRW